VFDEIPSRRREPLSQGQAIFFLAAFFALFLVSSAGAWFRWSGYPLSVSHKISLGEFALGSLISGVFLLTAKSATPKGNQKRLWGLLITMMLVQLILDVLR
jgi:hypothetical protein